MQTEANPRPQTQAAEPLTLPPQDGGWRGTIVALLGTLMFGAILVGIGLYTLPNLVTDWQIRDTARPVADGRVADGSCTSKLVLSVCDASLSVSTKTGALSRRVNYIFTDMHFGNYSVTVMADPARPELPTTDMALDRLWNRTITLLVGGGILLALTVAPIVGLVRRLRGARTA